MFTDSSSTTARLCLLVGSLAIASLASCASTQNSSSTRSSVASQDDHSKMQLPPGWTEADMAKCTAAGIPGKMHEHLAKGVGVWHGEETMWMGPGMEPMKSQCTSTITSMMGGRFTKCEVTGEMEGMGPFNGLSICGYDNVTQDFVGMWIDNMGTMMMNSTGDLSSDGKTMTWTYHYTCPITNKPDTMRQVERMTGDNTMVMEMFANDPKSGKEYKMLHIDFTRTSGGT